jgi:hypothetical protein
MSASRAGSGWLGADEGRAHARRSAHDSALASDGASPAEDDARKHRGGRSQRPESIVTAPGRLSDRQVRSRQNAAASDARAAVKGAPPPARGGPRALRAAALTRASLR